MSKKFEWVTENTRKFMKKGYLTGQSVEERCEEISHTFYKNVVKMGMDTQVAEGLANEHREYFSDGLYSKSTPVWVSYGNDRGLPIACYGSLIDDNMEGILYAASEIGMLTKLGGGTSAYLGNIRPRGTPITGQGEADGPAHFARLLNAMMQVSRQGSRRGYLAAYLDATHPDIEEFMKIGSDGSDIQNITTGVCFSDQFMKDAFNGKKDADKVLASFHKARGSMGYPYALFTDNANRGRPQVYKDYNLEIKASNLCNEIMLPSTSDESFVCVLSSINLTKWDHPKFARAIRVLTYFLDTVIFEALDKLKKLKNKHNYDFLERIERFLTRHRALGMGVLGWHHLLQSKLIPFESRDAAKLNVQIFKLMREESYAASRELADWFGEPELLKGYGMRNTTTMAIAPTKSSSFILNNVSEGIQPELSNCYLADLAGDTIVVRNPYLEKWLQSVGMNTQEMWDSIQAHTGSISHIAAIPDPIKDVFKTFPEISPIAVIDQAAARQPNIDQGQSLNLIFHPKITAGEINFIFYRAWQLGVKGLYYQIGMSAAQAHNTKMINLKSCVACEG
jgi:ribonucleoside-diphosphate reductase alpha chain